MSEHSTPRPVGSASRIASAVFRRLMPYPRVHSLARRTLHLMVPQRFRQPLGEFLYTHWTMTSAACSSDGRQLGEGNTVPQLDRKPFPSEYRVGKLDGSRAGLPVNQSALLIVMRNWNSATSLIAALRGVYVERRGLGDRPLNYAELVAFTRICTAISAYLLRRMISPVADGQIPVPVATIYKLVMGVHATIDAMINNDEPWFDPDLVPTAAHVYEYADSHGLFISRSHVACGGPEAKVLQLVELLVHGRLPSVSRQTDTQEVLPPSDLAALVDYGLQVTHMEVAVRLFQAQIASVFTDPELRACARDAEELASRDKLTAAALSHEKPESCHDKVVRRASTLSYILASLGGARHETEDVPGRISEIDGSYLNRAVRQYRAIVTRAYSYCNDKQNEIQRCLGIQRPVEMTERQVAARLNRHLHERLKRYR